jgi:alpha-amylase/alpha-mannosidase (GH57 family)
MHQPYYRFPATGVFEMPWARLHALKDYGRMVERLAAFPCLHQTFNLVPSLVEQLQDYASGDFHDLYWERSLKPAAELDPSERLFLLQWMCERPDHPRAQTHPRYLELAQKREACLPGGLEDCVRSFSTSELRDLQIWFNLAWFTAEDLEAAPLAELVGRGRDFGEADKQTLAIAQQQRLRAVLPAYRAAAERGQVELSTSPYYHPIMPLLADTDTSRISRPESLLPLRRFAHPEDAAEQMRLGLQKHLETFGGEARGVWCSEQAVGEIVLPLLMDAGIRWTISDDTVLRRSLAGVSQEPAGSFPWLPATSASSAARTVDAPDLAYHPYRLEREGRDMVIVFRDHALSDLIGFVYRSWEPAAAAADLLARLRAIHETIPDQAEPGLVTIGLDGENAWEYYQRNATDFFQHLYEGLSEDPAFRCLTVSEHLDKHPPSRRLDWLHTGSWIGGDLGTWIGEPAHNSAWLLLHGARDAAAAARLAPRSGGSSPDQGAVDTAWRHVLIAEGSDWFWWFGAHHQTDLDATWDLTFRTHLREVYRLLGQEVPAELFAPLLQPGGPPEVTLPACSAQGDESGAGPDAGDEAGVVAPGYEWCDGKSTDLWSRAGIIRAEGGGTMQRAEPLPIVALLFNWDNQALYLKLQQGVGRELPWSGEKALQVKVVLTRKPTATVTAGEGLRPPGPPAPDPALPGTTDGPCLFEPGGSVTLLATLEGGAVTLDSECNALAKAAAVSCGDNLDIAIPLELLSFPPLSELLLRVGISRGGVLELVLPARGPLELGRFRA